MTNVAKKPIETSLKEFLETVPPGRPIDLGLSNFEIESGNQAPLGFYMKTTPLFLHCGHSTCGGMRVFEPTSEGVAIGWHTFDAFLYFKCRNCGSNFKTFALRLVPGKDNIRTVHKFGEMPPFGPPLSAKLLQLAGGEGDTLRKGRQSENQSLGIGAFAYYRRVVEQQKSHLIDELRSAVERLGGDVTALAALESARQEGQFAKAIKLMADVTPKELYVGGRNPLTLLHGPLSVGLHTLSDEECLKLAHNIRIVLSALLERIQMVTEEKADLDAAIKELLQGDVKAKGG